MVQLVPYCCNCGNVSTRVLPHYLCLKVALEDLRKMRLELHLLITGSHKGSKASSRGGKSEEACEIVSLILQRHRDDLGEAEEISVEELLPEEEARKVCTFHFFPTCDVGWPCYVCRWCSASICICCKPNLAVSSLGLLPTTASTSHIKVIF